MSTAHLLTFWQRPSSAVAQGETYLFFMPLLRSAALRETHQANVSCWLLQHLSHKQQLSADV